MGKEIDLLTLPKKCQIFGFSLGLKHKKIMNLYDETIEAICGRKIAYAKIKVHNDIFGDDVEYINLKPNHTYSERGEFYNSLRNVNYDNGYGSQYIFGFVVFTDGTWIEREECDGVEWWDSKRCPIFTDLI